MRMLMLKGAVVASEFLEQWVRPVTSAREELRVSVARLRALQILGSPPPPAAASAGGAPPRRRALDMNGLRDSEEPLVLNGYFGSSLQGALTASEGMPWQAASAALPPLAAPPRPHDVEAYAAHRWNCVLHFLVGTADAPVPEPKVVELLVSTHLLAPGASSGEEPVFDAGGNQLGPRATSDAPGAVGAAAAAAAFGRSLSFDDIMSLGDGAVHITTGGYEFLLKDTGLQLWTFLHEYLRTAPARGTPTTEILAFLFEVGLCRPREGYAVSALTPSQRALLDDFASFGLVYLPPEQELVPEAGLTAAQRAAAAALPGGAFAYDDAAGGRRFFPTSLAAILTQPPAGGDAGEGSGSAFFAQALGSTLAASSAAGSAGGGAGGGAGSPIVNTDGAAGKSAEKPKKK